MKKFLLLFLILIVSGLCWYLFIKKYDYQFQMEAKYGPGTVYQEISDWKKFNESSSEDNIVVTENEPFKNITQTVSTKSGSSLEFFWEFEKIRDTLTQVTANVRSKENTLANRWAIINPFSRSIYIDTIKQNLLAYGRRLKNQQEAYNIQILDSVVISPALDCICHSLEDVPVKAKALEMVNTIGYLENYILNHDLKLTGNPFVKITRWNRKNNIIDFDFCFPVNLAQDIRPSGNIEFRQIPSSTSLKAVFHGNYRLSHVVWNELLYKAERDELKTNELPLEIFYNNPKAESSSPISWKADVFLPVTK